MKAIVLIGEDGGRHLAFVAPMSFDVQAWANSRRQAFALLRIVRVVVDERE
jgi:hypothetical protein